jgi:hypothetical protein
MATVPREAGKAVRAGVEKVSEKGKKNGATHSTHIDERKHVYLVESKEKRVRSLDTLSESYMHEKSIRLEARFGKLISAARIGNYERAASSCSKAW